MRVSGGAPVWIGSARCIDRFPDLPIDTAVKFEMTGAIHGRRAGSSGLSLGSDLYPGITPLKKRPHTRAGAENSHGSDGYEENIHAGTHTPSRRRVIIQQQNACHSMACSYLIVNKGEVNQPVFPIRADNALLLARGAPICSCTRVLDPTP